MRSNATSGVKTTLLFYFILSCIGVGSSAECVKACMRVITSAVVTWLGMVCKLQWNKSMCGNPTLPAMLSELTGATATENGP